MSVDFPEPGLPAIQKRPDPDSTHPRKPGPSFLVVFQIQLKGGFDTHQDPVPTRVIAVFVEALQYFYYERLVEERITLELAYLLAKRCLRQLG